MPQDHLRKLNDTNRELTKKLKNETKHPRKRTALGVDTISPKKKAAGSDLSSTRGSEERNSSVPTIPRGQKRGRDLEIEKVGNSSSLSRSYSVSSEDSPLGPSPESSPGLPGFPKFVRRNNSRVNRSPLHFTWKSHEPPAKRLRESPEGAGDKSADRHLSSKIPQELLSSSSSLSSAPPSPNHAKTEFEGPNLRKSKSNGKTKAKASHPVFGNALLGTKHRSKNDPWGIHGEHRDYPCEGLDNLMHRRLEYKRLENNPYAQSHPKIKEDPRANAAKRLFFEGQNDSGTLMIAGVPLEEREAMFPPPPSPKPTGRKKSLRKPKKAGKRPISTSEGEKEIENAERRKQSEEEVENAEGRKESEEDENGSAREETGGDVGREE